MKHLQLHFDRGVETVTLNRPEVRNAFNDEVIAELTAVFAELAKRPEVRCVVLAGNGPAFCAGADLNWMKRMAAYTRDDTSRSFDQGAAVSLTSAEPPWSMKKSRR